MNAPLHITLPTNDEIMSRLKSVCSDHITFLRFVYPHIAIHGGQVRTPMEIVWILKVAVTNYVRSAQCARMKSAVVSLDNLMTQFIEVLIPDTESAETVKAYWERSK